MIKTYKVRDADILFISVDSECEKKELARVVDFLNMNFCDTLKIITGLKMKIDAENIICDLHNARMVCSSEDFKSILNSRRK